MSLSGISFYHDQIEFELLLNSVSYGQESIQEMYCTLYSVFYANIPNFGYFHLYTTLFN